MIWQRALVTGASSGIGRAIARQLGASGTEVVVVARDEKRLEETADVAADRFEVVPADLSKSKDLKMLIKLIDDEEKPIDLVVNNAGIWTYGPLVENDPDYIAQLVDVNVNALVQLSHAAAKTMSKRGSGYIMNVSSIAGGQPLPWEAVYGASKAFVSSFTQALHEEMKGFGVGVTALLPGLVHTELQSRGNGMHTLVQFPEVVWMAPEKVAQIALEYTAARKAVCVPGMGNKMVSSLSEMTPRSLRRYLSAVAMRSRLRSSKKNEQGRKRKK